jgi:uncharacterized protein YukE
MSEVRINDYRLGEAKSAAQALENSINTTYQQCEELISYTQAATWDGQARDAFLTYLEIIYQYHNDLKEAAALQTKALNNLEGYFNDFQSDSAVREVRNL